MKLSVSVPDDLWVTVNPDNDSPSEVIQNALRVLADSRVVSDQPLANAPDQENLDRYRPDFEKAVAAAERTVRGVLDAGYQFGLLLAPGMALGDFPLLDRDDVAANVRELVQSWAGELEGADLVWSLPMKQHAVVVLSSAGASRRDGSEDSRFADRVDDLIGDEDTGEYVGIRWVPNGDGDALLPVLTDGFVAGLVAALRDVRDETLRRVNNPAVLAAATTEPTEENQ